MSLEDLGREVGQSEEEVALEGAGIRFRVRCPCAALCGKNLIFCANIPYAHESVTKRRRHATAISVQTMGVDASATQCWPSRVGSLVRYRPEALLGGVPKVPRRAAISVVLITIYSITEPMSIIYIMCYQSHASLTPL